MGFDPIEGVDYIFDRYAYLGLPADADKKDIQAAIRAKRASVHEDRLIGVDDDIKTQAKRIRELVDQCAEILLNDDLRPLYTARLLEFKEQTPERVSVNGSAIVHLRDEYFSLDSLLSEDIPDTSHLEARIKELTQFDDAKFAQMQSLHAAMPGNGQVRDLYKQALTMKLVYLSLVEEAAWAKIGFVNKRETSSGLIIHPEKYLDHVEAEIRKVGDKSVPNALAHRNSALQIGVAKPPLLLAHASAQNAGPGTQLMTEADMKRLREVAQAHIDARADYIRKIAQQKQDVLAELVTFAETADLSPRDPNSPHFYLYLVQPDEEPMVLLQMIGDASSGIITGGEDFERMPLEELRRKPLAPNSIAVIRNPEISAPLLEIGHVGQTMCDDWEKRKKSPAPPPPAMG